jgi:hypothetical protein
MSIFTRLKETKDWSRSDIPAVLLESVMKSGHSIATGKSKPYIPFTLALPGSFRMPVASRLYAMPSYAEWFRVSHEEAIAIIEKWSTWMRTHPYQSTQELRSGAKWFLKDEEKRRASNMSQFMKEISLPTRCLLES